MSEKEKYAVKYAKMFFRTMKEIGRDDAEHLYEVFYTRYIEHLNSKEFQDFSRYKTIILEKVYCSITHAQICLELGILWKRPSVYGKKFYPGTSRSFSTWEWN